MSLRGLKTAACAALFAPLVMIGMASAEHVSYVILSGRADASYGPPGGTPKEAHDSKFNEGRGSASALARLDLRADAGDVVGTASGEAFVRQDDRGGSIGYRAAVTGYEPPPPPPLPTRSAAGTIQGQAGATFASASLDGGTVTVAWAAQNPGGDRSAYISFGIDAINLAESPSGTVTGRLPNTGSFFGISVNLPTLVGTASQSSGVGVVWGYNGLPYLSPDDPMGADPEDAPADIPAMTTGMFFTTPSVAGFGVDKTVYFDPAFGQGATARPSFAAMASPFALPGGSMFYADSRFSVEGTAFSMIDLPYALPSGVADFLLSFGGQSYKVRAGETFDFTRYVAGGVTSFDLTGIGAGVPVDLGGGPRFAVGFRFAEEGLARISQIALEPAAVPEPSSLALVAAGIACLGWRLRLRPGRHDPAPGAAG